MKQSTKQAKQQKPVPRGGISKFKKFQFKLNLN
jgi:hypothetical protein